MPADDNLLSSGRGDGGDLERVMRLRAFEAFADLPPAQIAGFAKLAVERFLPAGTVIQPAGTPAREVHYLIEGEVELRRAAHPAQRLGPRSVINGLASLAQVRRSDEVVAVTDTTLLSFTHEDQKDVFEDNFEICRRVMRAVAAAYLDAQLAAGPAAGQATTSEALLVPTSMDMVDRIAVLRAATPFDRAPLEALAELAQYAPEVRYPAGQRLWNAGDEAGWGVAVMIGCLSGSADGVRRELRFPAGTVAGALDTLAGRARWFDAVSETEVVALRIEANPLFDLLEDHTDMALQLLGSMARGVIALSGAQ